MKKVITAIVAAALLLTAVPTLAATPSKTTDDLTRIVSIQSEAGNAGSALIYVREEPTDFAKDTLKAFMDYKAKNQMIADFFSAELQESILKLLPANTDLKKMIMSEFVSIGIGEYIESYGDVTVTFQFPTEYKVNEPVIAVLGYLDTNGATVWVPLKTEVDNGKLVIVFPTELLTVVGHDAVIAVLSN